MLCKIADLLVDVPEAGGMAPRCRDYLWQGKIAEPIITIQEQQYEPEYWSGISYDQMCYLESGHVFDHYLVRYNGLRLHASAFSWGGRAYLFSADSGTGKSTHRKMWQALYGEDNVVVFNDDKPSLRLMDGKWYAYGTPWCGREGINKNAKVPLAGICFLEQGPENHIRRLKPTEILPYFMNQTVWRMDNREDMEMLMASLDKLFQNIPIYLMQCTPTTDAAKLSSETMLQGAIDAGL